MRPLTPNSGPNFWDGRYLGSVVESVLRSRCRTSKELARTLSPCDAPVPVKAADRAYGNRACSRFFRSPRAAGTIGRRSCIGTLPRADGSPKVVVVTPAADVTDRLLRVAWSALGGDESLLDLVEVKGNGAGLLRPDGLAGPRRA